MESGFGNTSASPDPHTVYRPVDAKIESAETPLAEKHVAVQTTVARRDPDSAALAILRLKVILPGRSFADQLSEGFVDCPFDCCAHLLRALHPHELALGSFTAWTVEAWCESIKTT